MFKRMLTLLMTFVVLSCSAHAGDFTHPGGLSTKVELDFVKQQIENSVQPWKGEFDQLRSSQHATRSAHGLKTIDSTGNEANVSRDDAIGAYAQALLWYFSDEEVYAKRSIAILNSWAGLQKFTSGTDQDRLQAGWIGSVFAGAAEIMRGHPDWSLTEVEQFQDMFKRAFYPQLTTASNWNGNVDLAQIEALMRIAVFNDDQKAFAMAIARLKIRSRAYFYLSSDGERPAPISGDGGNVTAFWSNPRIWIDGLTQETCRDNGHHSQFGLGSAFHAAEVAWHQDVDVYGEHKERYTAAMELLAKQLLSDSMCGTCQNDSPTTDLYDAWEMGYNHYHNRMGIALPNTKQLIEQQIRPSAPRAVLNLSFDMLTHQDVFRKPSRESK